MSQAPDLHAHNVIGKNTQTNKRRTLIYFLILLAFISSISYSAFVNFDWSTARAQQNPPVANPDTYNVHGTIDEKVN